MDDIRSHPVKKIENITQYNTQTMQKPLCLFSTVQNDHQAGNIHDSETYLIQRLSIQRSLYFTSNQEQYLFL